ncbi:MAG: amino acid ABC transporter permease [Acidimicrobiales bacterium]
MGLVLSHLGLFARGAWVTVELTMASFAIAFVVGLVVTVCRVSPVPPLRWAATAWVELLRNTPLIVLFRIFFFGLPKAGFIVHSPFLSAVIVLSAYTSTFVAETVRAGVSSVSRGQAEAARALGLTFAQTLRIVVLPQALRTVVAPLGSVFIALIKNSGIAEVIAVIELTSVADSLSSSVGGQPIPAFLGAAAVYLAFGLVSGAVIGEVERRVAVRR